MSNAFAFQLPTYPQGAYSQIVMAGSIGFDVSRFPEGVYFWEYRDEIGRRETGRFEVVH
jgi:hypothetical protein